MHVPGCVRRDAVIVTKEMSFHLMGTDVFYKCCLTTEESNGPIQCYFDEGFILAGKHFCCSLIFIVTCRFFNIIFKVLILKCACMCVLHKLMYLSCLLSMFLISAGNCCC